MTTRASTLVLLPAVVSLAVFGQACICRANTQERAPSAARYVQIGSLLALPDTHTGECFKQTSHREADRTTLGVSKSGRLEKLALGDDPVPVATLQQGRIEWVLVSVNGFEMAALAAADLVSGATMNPSGGDVWSEPQTALLLPAPPACRVSGNRESRETVKFLVQDWCTGEALAGFGVLAVTLRAEAHQLGQTGPDGTLTVNKAALSSLDPAVLVFCEGAAGSVCTAVFAKPILAQEVVSQIVYPLPFAIR